MTNPSTVVHEAEEGRILEALANASIVAAREHTTVVLRTSATRYTGRKFSLARYVVADAMASDGCTRVVLPTSDRTTPRWFRWEMRAAALRFGIDASRVTFDARGMFVDRVRRVLLVSADHVWRGTAPDFTAVLDGGALSREQVDTLKLAPPLLVITRGPCVAEE